MARVPNLMNPPPPPLTLLLSGWHGVVKIQTAHLLWHQEVFKLQMCQFVPRSPPIVDTALIIIWTWQMTSLHSVHSIMKSHFCLLLIPVPNYPQSESCKGRLKHKTYQAERGKKYFAQCPERRDHHLAHSPITEVWLYSSDISPGNPSN